jgi:hypothetical protein
VEPSTMPKFDETEFKQLLLNIDPNDVDKQADVYGGLVLFLSAI